MRPVSRPSRTRETVSTKTGTSIPGSSSRGLYLYGKWIRWARAREPRWSRRCMDSSSVPAASQVLRNLATAALSPCVAHEHVVIKRVAPKLVYRQQPRSHVHHLKCLQSAGDATVLNLADGRQRSIPEPSTVRKCRMPLRGDMRAAGDKHHGGCCRCTTRQYQWHADGRTEHKAVG